MLYDPNWQKTEVKADPFSLESLIAWLEKQPANGAYDYTECNACMLHRYFTSMGFEDVKVTPRYVEHDGDCHALPEGFDAIAVGPHTQLPSRGKAYGWTFGNALSRARAAASKIEEAMCADIGVGRIGRPKKCEGCGVNPADPPSRLCPGCDAYRDHQR